MSVREKLTERRGLPGWAIVVVAALVVAIIGIQAAMAQHDNARRDQAQQVQDQRDRDRAKADRERAECLDAFAQELVDTINTRNAANRQVALAQEAKDDALDDLLSIIALARETPPRATDDDFNRALRVRLNAQRDLDKAKRDAAATLAGNPYQAPDALCGAGGKESTR